MTRRGWRSGIRAIRLASRSRPPCSSLLLGRREGGTGTVSGARQILSGLQRTVLPPRVHHVEQGHQFLPQPLRVGHGVGACFQLLDPVAESVRDPRHALILLLTVGGDETPAVEGGEDGGSEIGPRVLVLLVKPPEF